MGKENTQARKTKGTTNQTIISLVAESKIRQR
jgi:hypothetical protein